MFEAKDVRSFLDWVSHIRGKFAFDKDDPFQPWFRGHENIGWELIPRLYRGEYGDNKRLKENKIEDEILEEFIVRAPALSKNLPARDDKWGWIFLMQHFGAPTRLLDWTESALLALYFAVKDNHGYYDAAVWALDPYELNKKALKQKINWVIPASAPCVKDHDLHKLRNWLPHRLQEKKLKFPEWPVAVYPSHIDRRISTQLSGFTVHADQRELNKLPDRNKWLTNINIPAHATQFIRRELLSLGIDESTIFPDLFGLGKSLHLKWLSNHIELPHNNVYTRLQPSPIHGVGVFAIQRIKKETPLFKGDNEEMLWIDKGKLLKLPRDICKLYEDYAVIKNEILGCPKNFNRLTMSWYLNKPQTGNQPNVTCDPLTYEFRSSEDIDPGEELTVDYEQYSNSEKICSKSKLRNASLKR